MKVTTARVGAALIAGTIAIGVAIVPAAAATAISPAVTYSFKTLDNPNDPTFNQLLGINNHNKIAGYGVQGHANKGYLLTSPLGGPSYHAENFPGSAETQVAGINDNGVTVGQFFKAGRLSGFYRQNGIYHKVTFPGSSSSNELLGINNSGIAVGDYMDSLGNWHAYRLNVNTHKFSRINIRNSPNVTATGINAGGTVVGYFTNAAAQVVSFLHRANGQLVILAKSGADGGTQAFGINKGGLVVGAFTIGGSTFGFTWSQGRFHTVNDPNGIGSTIITGVNNAGDLVGSYTDRHGNTNGLLAIP
ncbi:MAG TPA: hypothetical protein VEV63_06745 [Streptosporangiaceae bacterium]|nr:hypothetical protein [Streptosporangiaceae bacterium]